MPGGRGGGPGVGQTFVSSTRDAGSDPRAHVFPVGFPEGKAARGLGGGGGGGGVVFDSAPTVVIQRAVHLSGGRGGRRPGVRG